MAHDPDEPSEGAGKAEDADSLCRLPPTPHEGRRMLVHATVRMPAPKTASNRPILIGYDGSAEAEYAIDVAARLLEPTSAVVLNVAPRLTVGESFITVGSPVSGDAAFEGLNKADALRRAEAGARLAKAAGLQADAHVCAAAPIWEGIVQTADEVDAAVIVLSQLLFQHLHVIGQAGDAKQPGLRI